MFLVRDNELRLEIYPHYAVSVRCQEPTPPPAATPNVERARAGRGRWNAEEEGSVHLPLIARVELVEPRRSIRVAYVPKRIRINVVVDFRPARAVVFPVPP